MDTLGTWYTVEPLYCGQLGDLVKCPVQRGVLIRGQSTKISYLEYSKVPRHVHISVVPFKGSTVLELCSITCGGVCYLPELQCLHDWMNTSVATNPLDFLFVCIREWGRHIT